MRRVRTVGSDCSPMGVAFVSDMASGDRLLLAAPRIMDGFSGDERVCDTRRPDGFVGTWASTGREFDEDCAGGADCDFAGGMVAGVGCAWDRESTECSCPKQTERHCRRSNREPPELFRHGTPCRLRCSVTDRETAAQCLLSPHCSKHQETGNSR